jgi:mannose-6-phosphate isomerase-like protein (cupin superfamily)
MKVLVDVFRLVWSYLALPSGRLNGTGPAMPTRRNPGTRESSPPMETTPIRPFQVARDGDRHAVHRSVGIGALFFKVTTADSNGAILIVEIAHHAKGGPPRHLHRDQDEWFHVTEGNYIVEIGDERYLLGPGDSAFGPRGVPHCWSNVSEGPGRITFVFMVEQRRSSWKSPMQPRWRRQTQLFGYHSKWRWWDRP